MRVMDVLENESVTNHEHLEMSKTLHKKELLVLLLLLLRVFFYVMFIDNLLFVCFYIISSEQKCLIAQKESGKKSHFQRCSGILFYINIQ